MKLKQVKEMPQNQNFIAVWMFNGNLWSELLTFEEGFEDGIYVLKRYCELEEGFVELTDEHAPNTEVTYYIQD